jgi:integrase
VSFQGDTVAKERTGSVYKNKNGNWFARVTFTCSNGKRKDIKRKATDKPKAKEILKALLKQLGDEGHTSFESSKMTFNSLAEHYSKIYLIPAEYIDERKIFGLRAVERAKICLAHFRQWFGNKKLREITYGDIFNYRSNRLKTTTIHKKTVSVATINRELSVLRRMFNIALREGWILKNPFSCGEPLIQVSAERRREKILSLEEETRLLKACEHPQRKHLKPFLIALLDTGARKGEMMKLKWSDVNFSTRLITIQALNTKTLKSRQVAITQRLYDELFILWESSDKSFDSRVFGITDNVRKSFSSVCKIAEIKEGGIDGLTLHSLRHTAATRLVKGQLPIQMVGRILGHTQPQTTYRYLSANDETLYQAASIFESIQLQPINDSQNESELIN